MTKQLHLLDEPEKPLTDRQEYVLERIVDAGAEGLYAEEIGAILHARKHLSGVPARVYVHDRDERCEYCGRDGFGIALELKKKDRVVRRGQMRFVAIEVDVVSEEPIARDASVDESAFERVVDRADGTRGVIPFRPTLLCATRLSTRTAA